MPERLVKIEGRISKLENLIGICENKKSKGKYKAWIRSQLMDIVFELLFESNSDLDIIKNYKRLKGEFNGKRRSR